MPTTLHPKYRPDIDGLRAVAVLSVVLFHAFPSIVSGGFIGVDIFFVISGYLITSIILQNIQNHSFSFGDFYARRIRRIFPALILVLIACHVVGWFLLMPSEYQQLGKHIAGGATFSSNFLLWLESGYFDSSAESKLLLHLWSLGIEEQFYILWPAILVLAHKTRIKSIKLIALILSVSLLINLWLTNTNPTAAFFLPISRFWELLAGAALAYYATGNNTSKAGAPVHTPSLLSPKIRNPCSLLGALLIALGLVLINRNSLFPGWWALLPTIGAVLLIGGGSGAWVNQRILAHPLLVWVGLISYSLYLWHWPIFTFYRLYSFQEISNATYLTLIALSICLAWLTTTLVEPQFRHTQKRWKLFVLILGLVGIGFIGWNCYNREGMPFRAVAQQKFNFHIDNAYGKTGCLNQLDKNGQIVCNQNISTNDSQKMVFLWGDSHAAHLNAGLLARLTEDQFSLLDHSLPACPPILNFLPRQERSDATASNLECEKNNLQAYKEITLYKPNTVLLAADWVQYDGVNQFNLITPEKISATIQDLKDAGVKNIVLIGNFPVFNIEQPRLAAAFFKPDLNNRTLQRLNIQSLEINKTFSKLAAQEGIDFLSPTEILCNSDGCLLSTSNEKLLPIGLDASHLSKAGSIYFINQTRNRRLLKLN
jgi:peptidoglycan/LPS O-acetylase OafA/YrhL